MVNRAPRPIQQVLISPSAAGEWGEDWLAHRTLSVGDSATLPYRGDCIADLRVVFDNRSAEERRDLDLCRAARVVIAPGWTTADAPGLGVKAAAAALLTVSNRSDRAVVALYVFPDGSAAHGPQLLASGGAQGRCAGCRGPDTPGQRVPIRGRGDVRRRGNAAHAPATRPVRRA